ncbi:hypothetical protein LVB77_09510 [Lysobacter sp. 5GHs7-4]|uniref:hypothetical protein n=1 Tax=Lysobacter sp. 5GHs7-4 TaxID=2904253 RepID=UPI001E3D2D34|nr:hypothetical protein [Lysobacter sp. 5GHs7-4]UHQ24887.1 hypothetical protein LVB77_09510 [Lysobacter sp. 5GHs7-4]
MPKPSTYDYADGHVIQLLPRLDAAASPGPPPEALKLPQRMGPTGRLLFALMCATTSACAAWMIYELWTGETPGWWFDLLFTVMIGGLALALWAILIGSVRQARHEARLRTAWHDIAPTAIAVPARVTDRYWALAEDGAVMTFTLTVQDEDGRTVCGEWHPEHSRGQLLQTQVPGIGAAARVWRTADAGADAPLVIEVADPSVVA